MREEEDSPPRLRYKYNALAAWWVTQATLFVTLLLFGDAPFRWIASRWGELATCAVVVADVASVGLYLHHRSRRRRRRWRRRVTSGAEGGGGRGGGRVGTAEGAEGADEDAADKDADAEDAAGEDELANPVYDVFMEFLRTLGRSGEGSTGSCSPRFERAGRRSSSSRWPRLLRDTTTRVTTTTTGLGRSAASSHAAVSRTRRFSC